SGGTRAGPPVPHPGERIIPMVRRSTSDGHPRLTSASDSPILVPPDQSFTAVSRRSTSRYERALRYSVTRVRRTENVNVSTRENADCSAKRNCIKKRLYRSIEPETSQSRTNRTFLRLRRR